MLAGANRSRAAARGRSADAEGVCCEASARALTLLRVAPVRVVVG